MKKTLKTLAAIAVGAVMFASCSTTTPITATSNPVGNKCGEASSTRVLGMFGGSDNIGINKAAKSAGITRISHVDFVTKNYVFVQKFTTRVYGE